MMQGIKAKLVVGATIFCKFADRFTGSRCLRYSFPVSHSSLTLIKIALTSRSTAAALGKSAATRVRRLSVLFKSSRLFVASAALCGRPAARRLSDPRARSLRSSSPTSERRRDSHPRLGAVVVRPRRGPVR